MTTMRRKAAAMPSAGSAAISAVSATLLTLALALPTAPALSAGGGAEKHEAAAKIEAVPNTKLKRLTLSEKAARRLDIQVGEIGLDTTGRKTAPFPAVVYDLAGEAWVYTSPAPLTFVRQKIVVEQVRGSLAILAEAALKAWEVAHA